MKNIHPVSGAGIRSHNLLNVRLLPSLLEQGSRSDLFVRESITVGVTSCFECSSSVDIEIKTDLLVWLSVGKQGKLEVGFT